MRSDDMSSAMLAPQGGFEPPYYARRPLRLVNSQVSSQLEYRGIITVRRSTAELHGSRRFSLKILCSQGWDRTNDQRIGADARI